MGQTKTALLHKHYFFSLTLEKLFKVSSPGFFDTFEIFRFCFTGFMITYSHAKAISKEVCEAEITVTEDRKAIPKEPETTANVVIHPSTPSNTVSELFCRLEPPRKRFRIISGRRYLISSPLVTLFARAPPSLDYITHLTPCVARNLECG